MSHNNDTAPRATPESASRETFILPDQTEDHPTNFDSPQGAPDSRSPRLYVRLTWWVAVASFLIGMAAVWAWVIYSVPTNPLPAIGVGMIVGSGLLAGLYAHLDERADNTNVFFLGEAGAADEF